MRKTYKFGEMMLILREEYKGCKPILDELSKCINIESEHSNYYFRGSLPSSNYTHGQDIPELGEKQLKLFVEKKYLGFLRQHLIRLKYDWYGQFLYSSYFKVMKEEGNLYDLSYDDILTPVDGKKYIPKVKIIDQNKFSDLVDKLFSSDLMQLNRESSINNHNEIFLDFQKAFINTPLGNSSIISWDGINDNFSYNITKYSRPFLIEDILSLEMPVDNISSGWVKLFEKHEDDFSDGLVFDINETDRSKKGVIYVSDDRKKGVVKLLKK